MKLVELTCPKCGATLQANPELETIMCNYCGNQFVLDDEVIHVQHDMSEEAGYKFEVGRMRARQEAEARKQEELAKEEARRQEELAKQRLHQQEIAAQRQAVIEKTKKLQSIGTLGFLCSIVGLFCTLTSNVVATAFGILLLFISVLCVITIFTERNQTTKRYLPDIVGTSIIIIITILLNIRRF